MNRRSFLGNVTSVLAVTAFSSSEQANARGSEENSASSANIQSVPVDEARISHIGNFHSFYPGGIAFLKDNAWGVVLDIGWDKTGKPGFAAPDQSIHRVSFDNE